MTQMLLFPDPRPLVDRLGADFFRQAPQCPGIYLMRDSAGSVLYVGKAKNLKRRLASYRVANPERMPRRHLRLVRAVQRIELLECADEADALARESELLRTLRPRFNRAGTWPGIPRWLAWRTNEEGLAVAVRQTPEPEWHSHGPLGAAAIPLRTALVRLLWCALLPKRGLAGMPEGWCSGRHGEIAAIPAREVAPAGLREAEARLNAFFAGHADEFAGWIRDRTSARSHLFEAALREADLETLTEFATRQRSAETHPR